MPLYLILIFIFSGIGILDTLYLSYHAIKKTSVACWFFPKEWCFKVQFSPQSKTFGIPNAFLGLAMYVSIFVFATLFTRERVSCFPISVFVTIGFLFSMYFTYVQARVLRAFCTWYVLSAINFIVLFVAVYFLR